MARVFHLAAAIIALLLAPLYANAAEPAPRLLALAYHNVEDADPDQSFLGITAGRLIEQFSWLKANGYTPVAVDAIVAANAGGPALPERAVLLAFDDGYESFYTRVLPILQAFDYPAVLALVGAWLEGDSNDRVGSTGRRRVVLGHGETQVQFGDKRIHRRTVGRTSGDSSAKVVRQSPEQVVARAIGEQRGDDRRERRLGRKLRG